jgi:HAMP domain-containing protein
MVPSRTRLSEELSALDDARQTLSAGDPSATLRRLDAFDRNCAQPSLGPEAMLLRIEALLALGRIDPARRLGEQLLAKQPDSAYGQRVRSLLAGAPTTNR